jgi:hypothetical protein
MIARLVPLFVGAALVCGCPNEIDSASLAPKPVANAFSVETFSPAVVSVCNLPSWHEMNCILLSLRA